jgi:hypothetical protein
MKISTLRTCLFLLNVLVVAGIGYVVFQGFQEKERRVDELRAYKQKILQGLSDTAGPAVQSGASRRDYPALGSVSLQGAPPQPVAPTPVAEVPKKATAPPLESLITITGIEVRKDPSEPSVIFYFLGQAPASATQPTLPVGRVPVVSGRPVLPPTGGGDPRPLVAAEGSVIELGNGFEATLQEVTSQEVRFFYDDQVRSLSMSALDTGPTGAVGRGGVTPAATGPISNDPGVWISWNPGKPQDGIVLTDMGVRALKEKGESVLEGIRFESELVSDGKPAIKLSHIPKDNVLRKAGAEDNDVLTHINGTRVSTRPDIVRYVEGNPNLPEYRVTFLRRGNSYTRVIRPPRL